MWENPAPGTEFPHIFCAGIGLLQLSIVLVLLLLLFFLLLFRSQEKKYFCILVYSFQAKNKKWDAYFFHHIPRLSAETEPFPYWHWNLECLPISTHWFPLVCYNHSTSFTGIIIMSADCQEDGTPKGFEQHDTGEWPENYTNLCVFHVSKRR